MFGKPNVGVGQYATLWLILAVVILGVIGWLLGATGGAAIVFIIAGAIIVFLAYAILARVYRFILHGSFSAPDSTDGDGSV